MHGSVHPPARYRWHARPSASYGRLFHNVTSNITTVQTPTRTLHAAHSKCATFASARDSFSSQDDLDEQGGYVRDPHYLAERATRRRPATAQAIVERRRRLLREGSGDVPPLYQFEVLDGVLVNVGVRQRRRAKLRHVQKFLETAGDSFTGQQQDLASEPADSWQDPDAGDDMPLPNVAVFATATPIHQAGAGPAATGALGALASRYEDDSAGPSHPVTGMVGSAEKCPTGSRDVGIAARAVHSYSLESSTISASQQQQQQQQWLRKPNGPAESRQARPSLPPPLAAASGASAAAGSYLMRPPTGTTPGGIAASSSTPSYPVLKAYLYCIGQKDIFDGLWDLDLVNQLQYVDSVKHADLVVHRRPRKGEKQHYYDQYRAEAKTKGIPFVSVWGGTAEELRLGLLPVFEMYAGQKSVREATTRMWRAKVKPNRRIKV